MSDALVLETLDACPLCGGANSLIHAVTSSDFETATGDYNIIECGICGLGFTNPRPAEQSIPLLYASRETPDFAQGSRGFVEALRAWATRLYLRTRLPATDRPLRVLDFGCGDGMLATRVSKLLRDRVGAASVTAVDFHTEPPHLLDQSSEDIRYLDYWSWRSDSGQYDVIFIRHVLEHHPDPVRLVLELKESLVPGGLLHVEVPNRRSIWARIFGRFYFGYYLPRHLMHFDMNSLRRALEKGNLQITELHKGHTPLMGRSLGYALSRNIDNLGAFGLLSYPLQVAADLLCGQSTTLRIAAKR